MIDLRHSVTAAVIAIFAGLFVVLRCATAPAPPPKREANPAERSVMGMQIQQGEKQWRREVSENFPDDNWSQNDDFHGKEYRKILEISSLKGIRIEDALRAIDDDIHTIKAANASSMDPRSAHAVPCKPRPFYD